LLERLIGKAYPPELLARDVLAGILRNRPIIVAPHHARRAWIAYRAAPELLNRLMPRGFARVSAQAFGRGIGNPGEKSPAHDDGVRLRGVSSRAVGQANGPGATDQ
jgi:hypothetical protein